MPSAFLLLLALSSCNQSTAPEVNRPLATAEVPNRKGYDEVRSIVGSFADQNHFAVQPLIDRPQGAVLFSMRLFRDDVSVVITQLRGEPVKVSAYPLCVCELSTRTGLQSAAEEVTKSLKQRLARR